MLVKNSGVRDDEVAWPKLIVVKMERNQVSKYTEERKITRTW